MAEKKQADAAEPTENQWEQAEADARELHAIVFDASDTGDADATTHEGMVRHGRRMDPNEFLRRNRDVIANGDDAQIMDRLDISEVDLAAYRKALQDDS